MREMILAGSVEDRRTALAKLLPFQRQDFEGLFRAMKGYPVTIRTLDPPLHEFLPHDRSEEHMSELQSPDHLVCRLLLEKKKQNLQRCNENTVNVRFHDSAYALAQHRLQTRHDEPRHGRTAGCAYVPIRLLCPLSPCSRS